MRSSTESTLGEPEEPASRGADARADASTASELEAAYALHSRALAEFEAGMGPNHPYVGYALAATAEVLLDLGRRDDALPLARRLLGFAEANPGDLDGLVAARELLTRAEATR